MQVTDLDTKEVTVTRTEKRYVLNEKLFDLDSCPDWAQWAAVDKNGIAAWYAECPEAVGNIWSAPTHSCPIMENNIAVIFDATDWQHSLIKRPEKVLEVTMADLEKRYGCKVKIVKEN